MSAMVLDNLEPEVRGPAEASFSEFPSTATNMKMICGVRGEKQDEFYFIFSISLASWSCLTMSSI